MHACVGRVMSTLQMTCGEAVELLREKQIDQVPILTETGYGTNGEDVVMAELCKFCPVDSGISMKVQVQCRRMLWAHSRQLLP